MSWRRNGLHDICPHRVSKNAGFAHFANKIQAQLSKKAEIAHVTRITPQRPAANITILFRCALYNMETLRRCIDLRREFSEDCGHWPGLLIVAAAARVGAGTAAFITAALFVSARVLVLFRDVLAAGCSETGQCKHFSRFLTGGGVDVEVLEEDFRTSC